MNLPPQRMEVVGGCRWIYNLHVAILMLTRKLLFRRVKVRVVYQYEKRRKGSLIIWHYDTLRLIENKLTKSNNKKQKTKKSAHTITHLQEPLDPGTRMLRPLAVISMGQGHNEARALQPLLLASRDELIDDGLSSVCKVTKLGLPYNESMGTVERVAQFKAQDTVLGKGRV